MTVKCEHLTIRHINDTMMTDPYSENSACTWRLGTCVLTGEDAIAFDEHMKNPVITQEQKAFFRDAADLYRRGVI